MSEQRPKVGILRHLRNALEKLAVGARWSAGVVAVAAIGTIVTLWITSENDERDASSNPFDIRIEQDLGVLYAEQPFNWTPYAFVLSRQLDTIPPPPSGHCRTWWSWSRGLGGVDARRTQFRVYLTGRTRAAVVLNRAVVHIAKVSRPPRGYLLDCKAGGAAVNPRQIAVNLDRRKAALSRGDADEPFLFRLAAGDIEVFDVTATTRRCDCRWWLELFFVQGERQSSVSIGSADDTFRTTGTRQAVRVNPHAYGWKLPRMKGALNRR